MVALAGFLIEYPDAGPKHAAVITHGLPAAFIVTLFLITNKDKQKNFIEEGMHCNSTSIFTFRDTLLFIKSSYYVPKFP